MKYNLKGKIGLSLMLPITMAGFLSEQDRSADKVSGNGIKYNRFHNS